MTDLEALAYSTLLVVCGIVGLFVAGTAYASVMWLLGFMVLAAHTITRDDRKLR
jgi:hypothetical protein